MDVRAELDVDRQEAGVAGPRLRRAAYDIPLYTGDVTGLGFTRVLEAARQHYLAQR
jgi:GDP-D-mannose dehydratase